MADEGINYSIICRRGKFMIDVFDNEGKLLVARISLPIFKDAIRKLSDEVELYLEKENGK